MTKKTMPTDGYPPGPLVECPKCHAEEGYCSQCNGWGYVKEGSPDALCVHEVVHHANVGRCLNVYRCTKCGHKYEVDSSD